METWRKLSLSSLDYPVFHYFSYSPLIFISLGNFGALCLCFTILLRTPRCLIVNKSVFRGQTWNK